jgi:flagellar biosynthesis protein FlhF
MTTLTVQAEDTATAMEQIADQLGPDALILSTTKRDGKIIMRASNDSPMQAGKKPEKAATPEFSSLFAAASRPVPTGRPKLASEGVELSASAAAMKASRSASKNMNGQASEAVSASAQQAMMQAISLIADRMEMLEARLSGMMLTPADGLNSSLQDSTPIQLMRAGFSQASIFALQPAYAGLGYEAGVTGFLEMLAEDLTLPRAEEILTKRVIFVVGPSGSGRTTLAAKLAASLKETHRGREVALASLGGSMNETDTRLRGLARLLNISVSPLAKEVTGQDFDKMTDFDMMVVDVTLGAEDAVAKLAELTEYLGIQDSGVVLTIPGGSSAKMIDVTLHQFAALKPVTALTKLDECETTAAEFSALHSGQARIGMLSGTKSVVGAIAFATQKILSQYLKENFTLPQ